VAEPVAHHYGKDAVSVFRAEGTRLFAAEVRLLLHGDVFVPSYTAGDNSLVVATDSMKNFIHAAALDYEGSSLEEFLLLVGQTFLERYGHVEWVTLHGSEVPFTQHTGVLFQRIYDDYGTAWLELGRDGVRDHRSGRERLHLIKVTGSSFTDFVRDEHTTLPEMPDRPLFIHLNVHWRHTDFGRRVRSDEVRDSIVATFDDFVSASIQHLVHEMGLRALDRFPEIEEISFAGENRLWDRAQDADGVAVYTDARPPFGVIELTLRR
jgi:urate oxidase/2-oxo-4-hydroxy-4-carboxy-5-ureidoimidazoline decarboxylase